MKIILQSKPFTFLDYIHNDKIYLFTQFFIPHSNERYSEIKLALKENVENDNIDEIILLNEEIYSSEQLGVNTYKIKQINIHNRLKFSDVFHYIRTKKVNGYMLLVSLFLLYNCKF